MAKKKIAKKNKGPKGKQARAKAKSDRQWGETVDQSVQEQARIRKGRSRLLKKPTRRRKEPTTPDIEDQDGPHEHDYIPQTTYYDSDDDDHDSASESDVDEGNALQELLKNIKKKQKKENRRTTHQQYTSDDNSHDEASAQRGIVVSNEEQQDESEEGDESDEDMESVSDDDESEDNSLDDDNSGEENKMKVASSDPFTFHFNKNLSEHEATQALADKQKTTKLQTPQLLSSLECHASSSYSADLDFSCLRKVFKQQWKSFNKQAKRQNADGEESPSATMSCLQQALWPALTSYSDMLITAETRENRPAVANVVALHILNHVLTSNSRIQKHNRKLKQKASKEEKEEKQESDNIEKDDHDDDDKFRDQGYTRPKVLIMLPTRGTCMTFVKSMMALLGEASVVDGMDRFEQEYSAPIIEEGEGIDNSTKRRKAVQQQKGQEWQELFGDDANDDDDFKFGISMHPKAAKRQTPKQTCNSGVSVKLYSDFYRSDIIVVSPLALKTSLAATEEDGETKDADFLSSIEICLVSHCNVLMMQNWDHVNDSLDLLNQLPKKNNDTDFSRVRNYLLAGQSAHWRQLILCSCFSDPYLVSTFNRHSKSIAGKFKLRRRTPAADAGLCNVLAKVKQVFQRVPCSSFAKQGDDRLQYFADNVLPQLMSLQKKNTLIFIPSYFDFVSVRNILLKREANFVSVTEYARVSEVTRGRARFLQGRKNIMLYTGRAHFFSRHLIKGVRHIIFFGLPEHAEFYSGMLNVLNEGLAVDGDESTLDLESPTSCLSLFTKYDAHALERIVGGANCERMLKREKNTFIFCS